MSYRENYQSWLNDARLPEACREELLAIKDDEKAIEYRFGGELEFGTAGMRGIIGCGMNMMNVFTVMRATQGLSMYIKTLSPEEQARGVVISYDTRRNSRLFAEKAASVLAKNGIKAYLFDDVHPVPMLSYAVRYLKTIAGIMITASHNPKEYNGYKVYGEDGAQMSPEATAIVVKYIEEIKDYLSVTGDDKSPLIQSVPKEVDETYIQELSKLTLSKEAVEKCGKDLKLVYTPVHGSGYVPVMTILKKLGINVTVVEEQTVKDTEFSTVKVPNPEFKETLSMGIDLANKIKADVVFGTDPDSDRLGVAVKDDKGEFIALSGNQVGILLLDYILTRLKEENALPKNAAVVKSFVSTGMAKAICDDFGVAMFETPVGFKFIGEKIKQWEQDGSAMISASPCSKRPSASSSSAKRSSSGNRTARTPMCSGSRNRAGTCAAPTRATKTPSSPPCSAPRWSAITPTSARRSGADCRKFTQSTASCSIRTSPSSIRASTP